jgi:hypothetical protein
VLAGVRVPAARRGAQPVVSRRGNPRHRAWRRRET